MRIGILTFHRADNFGAVLQAYALQKYLLMQGNNVDIIDYRCRAIEEVYQPFCMRNYFRKNIKKVLRRFFFDICVAKDVMKKHCKFEAFRKQYLHLSRPVYDISDIVSLKYDTIVVGSDQVWNKYLTSNDLVYFIPMVGVRRVSYAVSMERSSLNDILENKSFYGEMLNSFSAISVREKAIADNLNKIGLENVQLTCDPTFLWNKAFYLELIKEIPSPFPEKYILVFHLQYSDMLGKAASELSGKTGYSIINIYAPFKIGRNNRTEKQDWGPLELLSLINNAEYVLTTSFHGVAFSLLLEKQFYAVKTMSTNRIESLLKCMRLDNRLISGKLPEMMDEIDYSSLEMRKSLYVQNSIDFINTSLA